MIKEFELAYRSVSTVPGSCFCSNKKVFVFIKERVGIFFFFYFDDVELFPKMTKGGKIIVSDLLVAHNSFYSKVSENSPVSHNPVENGERGKGGPRNGKLPCVV